MIFTNSPLVAYTKLSPNNSGLRNHDIDRITPHCVVGQATAESLGDLFARESRHASSNYGIGHDGKVGMYVEEKNRSWCSSSTANDQRAITIECASDNKAPYAFYDVVYNRLIELCTDICSRYGKKKLLWISDKDKSLAYTPAKDEMLLTVHKWFSNTCCPGQWLMDRMEDLATQVTTRLQGLLYRVQCGAYTYKDNANKAVKDLKSKGFDAIIVMADTYYKVQVGAYSVKENADKQLEKVKAAGYKDAYITTKGGTPVPSNPVVFKPYSIRVTGNSVNIRSGPSIKFSVVKKCPAGVYTIIEEASGQGANKWGKLKSGVGWVSLDVVKKI